VLRLASTGTAGADTLVGLSDDDTLDGGAGNDLLRGGEGDDTYVFGLGYGSDRIEDKDGANVLKLGADIAPEDLVLSRSGLGFRDLSLQIAGTNDRLRIVGEFGGKGQGVSSIEFADSTVWDLADIGSHAPLAGGTRHPTTWSGAPVTTVSTAAPETIRSTAARAATPTSSAAATARTR